VEESQGTVEVGSRGEALGFPWEGDSNEVEKTSFQSQSVKKKTGTCQFPNIIYKRSANDKCP